MKFYYLYIFEILIHFYPNLVVKLAKISPKMVVKNDVIFGKKNLSRHQPSEFENPPPPKPMTSFCERHLRGFWLLLRVITEGEGVKKG